MANVPVSTAVPRYALLGKLWMTLYWGAILTLASTGVVLFQTRAVMWDAHAPWWPRWSFGGLFLLSLASATLAGRMLYCNPSLRRPWLFTHPLAAMVGVCCAAIFALTLKATVLPWPMRELRVDYVRKDLPRECSINSWGMRDVERQVEKAPGEFRVLFVGDSFLEGLFCPTSLSMLCESGLSATSGNVSCVNLGVSGTSPVEYYYRLKNVGQKLSPDAVCLFIYSGNDYLQHDESYRHEAQLTFDRWIDERPRPSLMGEVSPSLTWLLQNRWQTWKKLSEKTPADELEILAAATKLPFREGVRKLAEHCHEYYYPQHSVSTLEEILSRGGPEWWAELREKPRDSEVLQGWILRNLIHWETEFDSYLRSPAEVPPEQVQPHVAATKSWIEAIKQQCDDLRAPLLVVLIPIGDTDPELEKFWEPFPAYRSFSFYQNARHAELSRQLEQSNIHFVDLWETLDGVPNSYRKTDSHWTEKGHQLVADRVVPEIRTLLTPQPVTVARQPADQDGASR